MLVALWPSLKNDLFAVWCCREQKEKQPIKFHSEKKEITFFHFFFYLFLVLLSKTPNKLFFKDGNSATNILRERSKYKYETNKLVNKPKPCENKYDEQ